jgi:hypothetical protein
MLAGSEKTVPSGPVVTRALRVLLESLVDYAGLYPPASLSLDRAVANYDQDRRGDYAWMLGKFVVPAAKASEVPSDFPLAIVGSIDDLSEEKKRRGRLQPAQGGLKPAPTFEVKASSLADVERIASLAEGQTVYVETSDLELLKTIARLGLRAKIRTGGVTTDAFPSGDAIAAFIRTCADLDLPFKATAGLHHPIRCVRPLTYEANAQSGAMHGFFNVFIAAALPQFAEKIMREDNPRAFAFDEGGLWWHDCRVTAEEIERVRSELAISFGSCSFDEPVADLKELGWL